MRSVLIVVLLLFPAKQKPGQPAVGGSASTIKKESTARSVTQPLNSGDKVSADDRLADYTYGLMWFTGALVITSAIQIGFLIKADKTARISADAAKDAALAARASAQSLPLIERAYVFADVKLTSAFEPPPSDLGTPTRYQGDVVFANYGRTLPP